MTTNENRHRVASEFIHAALRDENSRATREKCAFDAGYVYLLIALNSPVGGEHPGVEQLQRGINQLGVGSEKMSVALTFLKRQDSPYEAVDLLEKLLHWAQAMRELATGTSHLCI